MSWQPLHHITPTIHSLPISEKLGSTVWLKMECYQPLQSFKIRGIGRLCQYYKAKGKTQFIASSGGNAGIAVAYAGKTLGLPVTVYIPKTSKQVYVDIIAAHGAKVIVQGDVWDEANQAALEHCNKDNNSAYIPPFDHPIIWSGHSTIVDEIIAQNIKPDAVVLAVGGGGLACGVIKGLDNYGWSDIKIYTVETEGAASFAKSVQADKLITLSEVNTIATTLAAKQVTHQLFRYSKAHDITPLLVSDQQAIDACKQFFKDHSVLVEPACGAALAPLYEKNSALIQYRSILVIVCGGVGQINDF